MLKPLLPSIPQKEILIEGKFYKVYEQLGLDIARSGHSRIFFCLNGKSTARHIRTFPRIKDTAEKDKAIHLYIEDILTAYHDYIEKHYVGDRFMKIGSLNKPRVIQQGMCGIEYVVIYYTYKRDPSEITGHTTFVQTSRMVGKAEVVTQDDIDAKMAEVEEHQRQTLEQFKIYVEEKRKAFREQVNKETAERDQQLQLQET